MIVHEFGDLQPQVRDEYPEGYPWTVIGVFPTEQDDNLHDWFDYTVGLGGAEMWCSCYSIEGRAMDNDLLCAILNVIGGSWALGIVGFGDQVTVPLGIPDEHGEWARDADAVFWLPTWRVPSRTKKVFMPECSPWTVPLIWSSPLGWPDAL